MTLKEKFKPHIKYWDCYNDAPLKYDHNNKCVKIAEDFAIGFAEWLNIQYRELNHTLAFREKTLIELLQIYKKEKGL